MGGGQWRIFKGDSGTTLRATEKLSIKSAAKSKNKEATMKFSGPKNENPLVEGGGRGCHLTFGLIRCL
jgi:hypothetical protein